jgi:carbon storage regulator
MLVLSREQGMSIIVASEEESCLITVLKLIPERHAVSMLFNQTSTANPGKLKSWNTEIGEHNRFELSDSLNITVVDLREDKVRVGIEAPRESQVHRLEVYEAIQQANRKEGFGRDPDEGAAGSRVPRPPSPKPPTLDVRLDEPRSPDENSQ